MQYSYEEVLRLSDAFEKPEALGFEDKAEPSLELVVRVININEGRNSGIAARCRKLAEYSTFIAKVRTYDRELGDKEAAMKAAIKFCLDHDILSTFLEQHSTEVFNMLFEEWDIEKAKEIWYEEAQETERENIARNALAEGATLEFVHKITGLDVEAIKSLRTK